MYEGTNKRLSFVVRVHFQDAKRQKKIVVMIRHTAANVNFTTQKGSRSQSTEQKQKYNGQWPTKKKQDQPT